jgi:hypothetical protein
MIFPQQPGETFSEYMARMQQEQMMQMQQQPRYGGEMMQSPPTGLIEQFTGGGFGRGAAGAEGVSAPSSGMGGGGIAGIIAAAIIAQHMMSRGTNTEFEGQKTDDAFAGNYGTEPWLAFLHDKLGWGPTGGEKFDAAVQNKDWGKALQRSPAMLDYWADPPANWAYGGMKNVLGSKAATAIDPLRGLLDWIGG